MKPKIGIVIPCFNENNTIIRFLDEIAGVLRPLDRDFELIVVNDGSTDNTESLLQAYESTNPRVKITILSLLYNIGHQGAIYQGLLYTSNSDLENIIVLDGDGEDDPNAIPHLLELCEYDIVHVSRGKRKESLTFRLLYNFYKFLFKTVTSKRMNIGNYCMINRKIVSSLVGSSFIHFAANLSKLKAKSTYFVADRRKRIDGNSKMNLQSLIYHAFKSFVVYAEDLLMLFLKLFLVICSMLVVFILYVIYQKIFTDKAILGWASSLSATLFSAALICMGFFVLGIILLNILQKNEFRQKIIYKVVRNTPELK